MTFRIASTVSSWSNFKKSANRLWLSKMQFRQFHQTQFGAQLAPSTPRASTLIAIRLHRLHQ